MVLVNRDSRLRHDVIARAGIQGVSSLVSPVAAYAKGDSR
jgi:hypothetical protein